MFLLNIIPCDATFRIHEMTGVREEAQFAPLVLTPEANPRDVEGAGD
jgi:hypothetical protein